MRYFPGEDLVFIERFPVPLQMQHFAISLVPTKALASSTLLESELVVAAAKPGIESQWSHFPLGR